MSVSQALALFGIDETICLCWHKSLSHRTRVRASGKRERTELSTFVFGYPVIAVPQVELQVQVKTIVVGNHERVDVSTNLAANSKDCIYHFVSIIRYSHCDLIHKENDPKI